jgi:hypothetical protein
VVRWRLLLQQYDFEIQHIAGKANVVADGLSRCLAVTASGIAKQLITKVHGGAQGHRGVQATLALLVEQGLDWDSMEQDVEWYLASCAVCQKVMPGKASVEVPLHTTMARVPFEVVAIDAIGPMEDDIHGFRYVLVCMDVFTRWVELVPAYSTRAQEAVEFLVQVFGRFGTPAAIRSDNGTQFVNELLETFTRLTGVKHQFAVPQRHESNGLVERVNREVNRHLIALIVESGKSDRWSELLPMVQRLLNSSEHSVLGTSPSQLLFGGALNLNRGLFLPQDGKEEEIVPTTEYLHNLLQKQEGLLDKALEHQSSVQANGQAEFVHAVDYKVGDFVLVDKARFPHMVRKLMPKWLGPYQVQAVVSESVYVLQDICTNKSYRVHRKMMRPFETREEQDPVEVAATDRKEWRVVEIRNHGVWDKAPERRRPLKKDYVFQVVWTDESVSWEPYVNVKDCEALVRYLTDKAVKL